MSVAKSVKTFAILNSFVGNFAASDCKFSLLWCALSPNLARETGLCAALPPLLPLALPPVPFCASTKMDKPQSFACLILSGSLEPCLEQRSLCPLRCLLDWRSLPPVTPARSSSFVKLCAISSSHRYLCSSVVEWYAPNPLPVCVFVLLLCSF